MRRSLALAVGLLSVLGRCAPALAQVAPLTSSVSSLTGGSGGGGSGDITDVNITTSSPLTGTATCATGACSFTLGLGTVTVAKGGTGLTAGTDGGILGYTASGTLASSVALTASALVLGGGAGATPTPMGSLGTTTTVLHGNAAGAPTFGSIVNADIANATIDLTTKVTGVLPVANGGSGIATTTAYSPVFSGTTATGTWSATTGPGTSGQVLTSNGAGAYPTWQAAAGGVTGGAANRFTLWSGATSVTYSDAFQFSTANDAVPSMYIISPYAAKPALWLRGATGQSAQIMEWWDPTGTTTVYGGIQNNGVLWSNDGNGYYSVAYGLLANSQDNGVAIGGGAGSNTYGVAVGAGANAGGSGAIAIGRGALAYSGMAVIGGYNEITDVYVGNGYINTAPTALTTYWGTWAQGTNVIASDIAHSGGMSTGAAMPARVVTKGGALGGTSGSTSQTPVTRVVTNATMTGLSTGTATALVDIPLASSPSSGGGQILYTIRATDGTDEQVCAGTVLFSARRTGGGPTYAGSTPTVTESCTGSSGALSTAWSLVAGTGKMTLKVTPTVTTITATTVEIVHEVHSQGRGDLAVVPF